MELNIERTEEDAISAGFADAVKKADANALCDWAPYVTDYDAMRRQPRSHEAPAPKRAPNFTECLRYAMDTDQQPFEVEAMQLILNAAKSTDEALAANASGLLRRMGAYFAWANS
jgi:hypothetical protein